MRTTLHTTKLNQWKCLQWMSFLNKYYMRWNKTEWECVYRHWRFPQTLGFYKLNFCRKVHIPEGFYFKEAQVETLALWKCLCSNCTSLFSQTASRWKYSIERHFYVLSRDMKIMENLSVFLPRALEVGVLHPQAGPYLFLVLGPTSQAPRGSRAPERCQIWTSDSFGPFLCRRLTGRAWRGLIPTHSNTNKHISEVTLQGLHFSSSR